MVDYNKLEKWEILALVIYYETPEDKRKNLNKRLLKVVSEILRTDE